MVAPVDLAGHVFGRLLAVRRLPGANEATWECTCACGNIVAIGGRKLRAGAVKSCGCLPEDAAFWRQSEAARARAPTHTHGQAGRDTGAYRSWVAMKQRCLNPKTGNFRYYGGRGVTVCDRWKESFEMFFSDLGPRPDGHTLDRIDPALGYEPGNVRWAPMKVQMNNRPGNRRIAMDGEILTLQQWCDRFRIGRTTVRARLEAGWSIEDALKKPVLT